MKIIRWFGTLSIFKRSMLLGGVFFLVLDILLGYYLKNSLALKKSSQNEQGPTVNQMVEGISITNPSLTPTPTILPTPSVQPTTNLLKGLITPTPQPKYNSPRPSSGSSTGSNTTNNNTFIIVNYPSPIANPTAPPTIKPTSTPVPVRTPTPAPIPTSPPDLSFQLAQCLNSAKQTYDSKMADLAARGLFSSGMADQVRSEYAAQQQVCHQQYGY